MTDLRFMHWWRQHGRYREREDAYEAYLRELEGLPYHFIEHYENRHPVYSPRELVFAVDIPAPVVSWWRRAIQWWRD